MVFVIEQRITFYLVLEWCILYLTVDVISNNSGAHEPSILKVTGTGLLKKDENVKTTENS